MLERGTMKILITSGGTKVKIDQVRHIGNMSKGTFGSKIAEEFYIFKDDQKNYVYAKNQIIVEGMSLLLDKINPVVVCVKLNSFLTPHERVDWKLALGR